MKTVNTLNGFISVFIIVTLIDITNIIIFKSK